MGRQKLLLEHILNVMFIYATSDQPSDKKSLWNREEFLVFSISSIHSFIIVGKSLHVRKKYKMEMLIIFLFPSFPPSWLFHYFYYIMKIKLGHEYESHRGVQEKSHLSEGKIIHPYLLFQLFIAVFLYFILRPVHSA